MEMRDPSSEVPTGAEEQTLNQAAEPQAAVAETENQQDPEGVAEEEVAEAVEEQQEEIEEGRKAPDKATLIAEAKVLLDKDPAEVRRESISRLTQQYNALRKIEIEEARTRWAEEGNAPEAFVIEEDADEVQFNAAIELIKQKKNQWAADQEEKRRVNLAAKNDIINKINELAEDTDNVNRTFPLYRELQDRFNAIGEVPPTEETAVWKRFQEAREHYSDNLKINKELRDYDFKKNLDSKILLIEAAEALDNEEDVITAFRRLQELHDKWRQIGPVAKELRDDIWNKFKDASAVVNKKYQAYFEERKARETKNEQEKTALCEEIEALDFEKLGSFNDWEEMTKSIIDLQARWKTLGFASKKVNNALFARFRKRCDEFFAAKAAYFKSVKEEYAANLAKKTALVERAEALKDSKEWKKATDEFVAMQKEWKTIGAVPKKHSDAIWKRFLAACDAFFDSKKQATSGQRNAELANLKAKKEIIEKLNAITDETPDDEAYELLQDLQKQWQETGHVPFRDKDKVNDAYREAANKLRRRLNIRENRARMERFESDMSKLEGDQAKLLRERDRLMRALESRRIEIRTYENNLGFLTSKSKSGESMVNEFRRKTETLKEDIVALEEKIRLIDSKLA